MYPGIKRSFDIGISILLLIALLPVFVLAMVLVKLSSPGPLFFTQERGGLGGVPFRSIKFRTMRADHVHDPGEIVPLTHNAITPIGRMLRRLKIDELPQLLNVLKGDMSLIGPRPTIMDQVVRYDDFQRRRLEVRPGCTGLAQVNATATMSWDERIKYDVFYVDHVSPLLDAMILLKTPLVIVLGEERFARRFEDSPYGSGEAG